MSYKLLVISSQEHAGVHQVVIEFDYRVIADAAFDNIVAAKQILRTATYAVKLYDPDP